MIRRARVAVLEDRHLSYVAGHAREADQRELLASYMDTDMGEVARRMWLTLGATESLAYCVLCDEVPTVVFGLVFVNPRTASLWAFATDDLPRVGKTFTRFAKAAIEEVLDNRQCRLQALSADFHTESHRWLERSLGLHRESTLREYGANGEDFHLYVRLR